MSSIADPLVSSDDESTFDLIDAPAVPVVTSKEVISVASPTQPPLSAVEIAMLRGIIARAQANAASSSQTVPGIEDAMNKVCNEKIQEKIEDLRKDVDHRKEMPMENEKEKIKEEMINVGNVLAAQSKTVTADDEKLIEKHYLANTVHQDAENLRNLVLEFQKKEESSAIVQKVDASLTKFLIPFICIESIGLLCGVLCEASKSIMLILVVLLCFASLVLSLCSSSDKDAEKRLQANRDALINSITKPIYEERTIRMSKENGKFGTSTDTTRKIIVRVTPGSPADCAGIKSGDKIVSINDFNVEKLEYATISDIIANANKETKFVIRTRVN